MFQVLVMYPNEEGVKFDFEYYRTKHMPLVEEFMKPHGLVRTGVLKGVGGGGGAPSPYVCVGVLEFDNPEGYQKGVEASGGKVRADISNFTNVMPVRVIAEVLS